MSVLVDEVGVEWEGQANNGLKPAYIPAVSVKRRSDRPQLK
jgi:hypothetical protein